MEAIGVLILLLVFTLIGGALGYLWGHDAGMDEARASAVARAEKREAALALAAEHAQTDKTIADEQSERDAARILELEGEVQRLQEEAQADEMAFDAYRLKRSRGRHNSGEDVL